MVWAHLPTFHSQGGSPTCHNPRCLSTLPAAPFNMVLPCSDGPCSCGAVRQRRLNLKQATGRAANAKRITSGAETGNKWRLYHGTAPYHAYTCIHTYLYLFYMYIYMYVYARTRIHYILYICMCMYTYMCMYMYLYVHIHNIRFHFHIHVHTLIGKYLHT